MFTLFSSKIESILPENVNQVTWRKTFFLIWLTGLGDTNENWGGGTNAQKTKSYWIREPENAPTRYQERLVDKGAISIGPCSTPSRLSGSAALAALSFLMEKILRAKELSFKNACFLILFTELLKLFFCFILIRFLLPIKYHWNLRIKK